MEIKLLKIPGKERISETTAIGPLYPVDTPSPGCFIMRRIEYQKGQKLGNCVYIKEVSPYISPNGRAQRKAVFLCNCGNEFVSQINSVKCRETTSCGCICMTMPNGLTHGLYGHPLYKRWSNMINRCYNPKSINYKYYGGRGITVCDEWRNDPKAYLDYIQSLPNAMNPGFTIDRIKNDKGYYPRNLRWADKHIQAVNQKKQENNTSGFAGVSWNKKSQKWVAYISVPEKLIHLGSHVTLELAVIARNQYILENKLTEYEIQKV